jgi:predicted MFS family arabinose efflux permease
VLALALPAPGLVLPLVAAAAWSLAFGAIPSFLITAAIRTEAVSADVAGAVVNATSNVGIAAGAGVGGLLLASVGLDVLPVIAGALLMGSLGIVVASRRGFPATAVPAGSGRSGH